MRVCPNTSTEAERGARARRIWRDALLQVWERGEANGSSEGRSRNEGGHILSRVL